MSPESVVSSIGELAGFPANSLIDQSGLSAGFVSGVTDFDTYIAGNPTHDNTNANRWVGTDNSGFLDFDLGAAITIESFVLWNVGNNNGSNINGFDLLGDDDGDFGSGAFNLVSGNANTNTGPLTAVLPEVFTFAPTTTRFVRLAYTSNGSIFTGAKEVAFEQSAVPEPSSLAMLGTAFVALGFAVHRRRRYPVVAAD